MFCNLVLRPQGAEEAAVVRVRHVLARARGLGCRGLSRRGLVAANLSTWHVTRDTSCHVPLTCSRRCCIHSLRRYLATVAVAGEGEPAEEAWSITIFCTRSKWSHKSFFVVLIYVGTWFMYKLWLYPQINPCIRMHLMAENWKCCMLGNPDVNLCCCPSLETWGGHTAPFFQMQKCGKWMQKNAILNSIFGHSNQVKIL